MLDDISYPGRPEAPAILGGSAVHAAAGMRLWTDRIGIVARASPVLPPEQRYQLDAFGFDLRGVSADLAQPAQAWQRIDADERRHERFRFPREGLAGLRISPPDVPAEYLGARAFHLLVGTIDDHIALIDLIRERTGALILVEPYYDPIEAVPRHRLRELLSRIDAFAPDLNEARAITGSDDLSTILTDLGQGGAIIVLRLGRHGAVIHDPRAARTVRVPAIGRHAVDVTGAGNAFSGGWLVGYTESRDIRAAASHGAVSASFAIEQLGPAATASVDRPDVDARLTLAQRSIEEGLSTTAG